MDLMDFPHDGHFIDLDDFSGMETTPGVIFNHVLGFDSTFDVVVAITDPHKNVAPMESVWWGSWVPHHDHHEMNLNALLPQDLIEGEGESPAILRSPSVPIIGGETTVVDHLADGVVRAFTQLEKDAHIHLDIYPRNISMIRNMKRRDVS